MKGVETALNGHKRPSKRRINVDPNKPGLAARICAQRLLSAIVDAHTPMDALTDDAHGHPSYLILSGRDRSLVRAILMVALRYRGDLNAILDRFIDKPLPSGAQSLTAILHVALAQILFLDVPQHSVVDLAVESANGDPRNRRFAPLVNAVTRRAAREKGQLSANIAAAPARAPRWFINRLAEIYGAQIADAIDDKHKHAANVDITLREETAENLIHWAARLDAHVLPTGSLRLNSRQSIAEMDGFEDGQWWVQDAAAAIPARLFGSLSGKSALDLCAAPGGKTAQLAARGARVVALEKSPNRAKRLAENLSRLQLQDRCELVTGDLFAFAPETLFDGVLLDAPCSSTGTVRRHPDVPWTKTIADIEKLAQLQARMLAKAADFVRPGGTLIFSNCSLDPLEGEEVARAFTATEPRFSIEPIAAHELAGLEMTVDGDGFARTTPADLAMEPQESGGLDGFFVARFKRTG